MSNALKAELVDVFVKGTTIQGLEQEPPDQDGPLVEEGPVPSRSAARLGTLQGPADRVLHVVPGEQTARPDPYPAGLKDGLGHPGDRNSAARVASGAAISGLSATILGPP